MKNLKDFSSSDDFKQEGRTLIQFHAEWCGPCKMMAPVIEELAEKYPDLNIVRVDVDMQPFVAGDYGVQAVPNLVLVEDSKFIGRQMGYMPLEKLEEFVNQ